jgi:hypothetical protein
MNLLINRELFIIWKHLISDKLKIELLIEK